MVDARCRRSTWPVAAFIARLGGIDVQLLFETWLRSPTRRVLLHWNARTAGQRYQEGMVGASRSVGCDAGHVSAFGQCQVLRCLSRHFGLCRETPGRSRGRMV